MRDQQSAPPPSVPPPQIASQAPASAVQGEAVLIAELADGPGAAQGTGSSSPADASTATSPTAPSTVPLVAPEAGPVEFQIDGSTLRRGSPFATGALLMPPKTAPTFGARPSRMPSASAQKRYASEGGMIAALVLGTFGLLIAPFRFEGAIVGFLGLSMGIWGLYSKRRGWALFGLILCCLAIGIGCYTGAFLLFRVINQSTPWEY